MVRILHVLGGLNSGGMATMIMNYYRNLDRDKIQFDFLVSQKESFYDDEVIRLGGKIHRITPRKNNLVKNIQEIENFFKNYHNDYKIIHIHQGVLNLSFLKKAKKYNIPVVIAHSHGINKNHLKYLKIYNQFYAKPTISYLATDYFSCSEKMVNHIFNDNILKSEEYYLMRNAIDTEKFKFEMNNRKKLREKYQLENKFIIGHVGTFLEVKNHEFIIDTFKEITNIKDHSVLMLIGDGKLKDRIINKVNEMNLSDKVIFLGLRNDVNELMSLMDGLIFPSLYEGYPLVLIEAQTSGLQCFISDSIDGGIKLTNLINFLSLKERPIDWAKKICQMYEPNHINYRKDYYERIIKCGFSIKEEAQKLQKFYLDKYNEQEKYE
ncbi:glycosyltransferase [Gracilibacillus sp. YIM 98692]|uniref:glycosyltransferase n=1 Tax=Gracilibacillus sp. YIM 98692 TaxID=2663532 RepID=UPI0013D73F13|nr:glycosyltransferase [Gracilibacillus sp. YIM 98692]